MAKVDSVIEILYASGSSLDRRGKAHIAEDRWGHIPEYSVVANPLLTRCACHIVLKALIGAYMGNTQSCTKQE